jgi:ABC-2 type transport system permease protein
MSWWDKAMGYVYRHWLITKRWPGESATLLVYPFVGLLSVGLFAYFITSQGGSPDSILFVLVGVVAWNFYEISNRGITYALTHDIWNDCLKHTFLSSSRTRHFLLGNSLWGLLGAIFSLVTVGIVGHFAFGANIFSAGIVLALNMMVIFVFAIGIGLMIDFLMLSKGEKWMALIWMMTGVIMIFSGVYYPIGILPEPMQLISMASPPTHAIMSIRSFMGLEQAGIVTSELLFGASLSLLYFAIGIILYQFGIKRGKTNGMITKY